MKNFALFLFVVLTFAVKSQSLNNKGQYVNEDGDLYTGTLTKIHDGVRSEYAVKDGVISGPATYYYASGVKMETGTFTNGEKDQKWVRYTPQGIISAVAFYKLGKKDGTWMVYNDKGAKILEMNYDQGSKSGSWTQWNDSGSVVSVKDFSKVN